MFVKDNMMQQWNNNTIDYVSSANNRRLWRSNMHKQRSDGQHLAGAVKKRKSLCFHLYDNSAVVQNLNFDDTYIYSRKIKSRAKLLLFHTDGFTDIHKLYCTLKTVDIYYFVTLIFYNIIIKTKTTYIFDLSF